MTDDNESTSITSQSMEIATELSSVESILEEIHTQKRARAMVDIGFVSPRTPTEKKLAEIWAEVLHLERVGIHDDFFELGGHSLLATQILSRVNEVFQIELPLEVLVTVEEFTVAENARAIEQYVIEDESPEKIAEILEELEGLSEEEIEELLACEDWE
jgi:acyl carrier protein